MLIRLRPAQRDTFWAYVFLAPAIAFFVVFFIYPVVRAVQYSLYYWPLGAAQKEYLGIGNYLHLFLSDPLFLTSIWNTVRFTLGTLVPTLGIALILALLLNQPGLRGRSIFRAIYFIPVVSSLVAVSFVWRWMLEPSSNGTK